MSTGFEKIGSDRGLQDHWLRRLIAFLIDSALMGVGGSIVVFLLSIPFVFILGAGWLFSAGLLPFVVGVLSLFYFAFTEMLYGYTLGKMVMRLKVVNVDGQPLTLDKLLLRNISKIYWLFLLIDVLVGLALPGDPQQKYLDRFAGTRVVSTGASLLPQTPQSSLPPSSS